MNLRFAALALCTSVAFASQANAFGFGLLGGHSHGASCCEPTCACEEPSCCVEEPSCCVAEPTCCEPSCCDSGCSLPRLGLLDKLKAAFHSRDNGCCEPTCGCEEPSCCVEEPSCCAPEPSCCVAEPTCGCEPACGDSCGFELPRLGLLDKIKGLFKNRCDVDCCEPTCGCEEPSCCVAEPTCGCAG